MPSFKSSALYRKLALKLHPLLFKNADGPLAIQKMGHRNYVGGYWEEMGLSQFLFMVGRGLKPEHVLLDIGCGAFRSGIHFMEYLKPGHYLGLEKEQLLIDRGMSEELGIENFERFRPEVVVSSSFEFEKFTKKPDFALAHSVFTHLDSKSISLCLQRLRAFCAGDCTLFATFFVGSSQHNLKKSCDHYAFYYSEAEITRLAEDAGWNAVRVADWHHPAGQKMFSLRSRL